MFAGNGAGMGTRGGVRAGNGAGLTTLQVGNTSGGLGGGMSTGIAMPDGGRYDEREPAEVVVSCSDAESDSGDDEDIGSTGDRRGVKRERAEMEVGVSAGAAGLAPCGYGASAGGGAAGAKPGKKTRGRVKIKMEFIDNKLRRYTTFSKRKTGIMKKAYELSTLTGTQVLLLVASETGHVYTFATRKLQPMITSETGKALIQTCLNSPDSPAPRASSDPSSEQRMSATGFEETELSYQVAEGGEDGKRSPQQHLHPSLLLLLLFLPPPPPLPSSTSAITSSSSTAPCWSVGANGTVLKSTGTPAPGNATSAGVVLPPGFTIMSGSALPPGTHTIPLSQLQTHALTIQTSAAPTAATATPHALQTLQSLPTLQAVHAPQQTQPVGLPVVTATTSAAAVAPVTHTLSSLPLQQGAPTHTFLRLPVSLAGAGLPQQLQLQVQASSHQGGAISSSSDSTSTSDINHITVSSSASHPTTIITSSSSSSSVAAAGHMMYSSPHAVMYATPTHAEGGGGLTVLNPFPPHSHSQAQDTGGVPQMFFTGPQGTVHAVPLHSMLIGQQQPGGGGSSNLTELRVVSLDSGKAD
ncbi:LOW QUALITY PROTEIN: serum response factor-like [Alosa sapidissima]|uniref:LOW QUALITY PROTEIN: serum response factor-like n=1 Tax=Alosa sapidissima TaxID=34773 RepID=UPI001C0A31CD|nr:LOW QUALITY PROTEIN: serum response factor-like [Alosa sapidissima]